MTWNIPVDVNSATGVASTSCDFARLSNLSWSSGFTATVILSWLSDTRICQLAVLEVLCQINHTVIGIFSHSTTEDDIPCAIIISNTSYQTPSSLLCEACRAFLVIGSPLEPHSK